MSTNEDKPRARVDDLVIRELESGEVVIYDRSRDRVHCLNPAAATVFRSADGTHTVEDLAMLLAEGSTLPNDPALVTLALADLKRANLLEDQALGCPPASMLTRRQALERLGYGAAIAALLPAVASVMAPEPAAAASCLPSGSRCGDDGQCCSNSCIGGICAPGFPSG